MKRFLISLLAFAGLAFAAFADAELIAPDQMVKNVADGVLQIIRNDKDIQNGDMSKITALTEQKILPHFDFVHMSRVTLGAYWDQATPEQQDAFVKQFKTLVTHTYSSALSKYSNQTIEYKPFLLSQNDSDVKVKSLIIQPGGSSIPVDYLLEKGSDEWKVFDVDIDGISLVTTYRGQFVSIIRQAGMDTLIHKLEQKNKS